jgi:hypothetical protein
MAIMLTLSPLWGIPTVRNIQMNVHAPLASGNIPHPCNSRYLGKIFLYIDHNHMEYLYIIYFIYFFSIKQLLTTEHLVDYLFSSELEIPRKTWLSRDVWTMAIMLTLSPLWGIPTVRNIQMNVHVLDGHVNFNAGYNHQKRNEGMMWLWSIYKNIFSRYLEFHGCVILPSTVGVGQYTTSMQFKVPWENILVYWPQSHGVFWMCMSSMGMSILMLGIIIRKEMKE